MQNQIGRLRQVAWPPCSYCFYMGNDAVRIRLAKHTWSWQIGETNYSYDTYSGKFSQGQIDLAEIHFPHWASWPSGIGRTFELEGATFGFREGVNYIELI